MFPGGFGQASTSRSNSPPPQPVAGDGTLTTPEPLRAPAPGSITLLRQLTVISQALVARKIVRAEQLLNLKTDEVSDPLPDPAVHASHLLLSCQVDPTTRQLVETLRAELHSNATKDGRRLDLSQPVFNVPPPNQLGKTDSYCVMHRTN